MSCSFIGQCIRQKLEINHWCIEFIVSLLLCPIRATTVGLVVVVVLSIWRSSGMGLKADALLLMTTLIDTFKLHLLNVDLD